MGADDHDRRIARRLSFPGVASTMDLGLGRRAIVRIEDLSPAGARIRLDGVPDRDVRPGSTAEVELGGLRAQARVVWCSSADGTPEVGISFSEPLAEFATIVRKTHRRA